MLYCKIKLAGCNLNCKYCPTSNRGGKSNDINKIKSFINACADNGVKHVKYSGGEPTIYPHFLELVEFASERGLYQSVSTNGTFDESFLKKMKSAGVCRLNISLDTLDRNKYIQITGKDFLDRVINNINVSASVFDEPTKINMVITDENINEVLDILEKFKTNPKVIVRFLQLTFKGDDDFTNNHRLTMERVKEALPHFEELKLSGCTFTNPVAKYYQYDDTIFALVPQEHLCYSDVCKRIWYEDGKIFNCKVKEPRNDLNLETLNDDVRAFIIDNENKRQSIHRIRECKY